MKQIFEHKDYFADKGGNIWSFKYKNKRKLKLWNAGRGYLGFSVYEDGKKRRYKVHLVIACLYVENPYCAGCIVCHKNDIRTDNRACNLYWGTHKENMADAFRNGKLGREKRLSIGAVKDIREKLQRGVKQDELADRYGVSQQHISRIKLGQRQYEAQPFGIGG